MDEIEKLKTEIKILNKRIASLEHAEHKRKALKRFKFIFNIIVLAVIGYSIWYGYDYITNYIPNQIEEGINNLIPKSFR